MFEMYNTGSLVYWLVVL